MSNKELRSVDRRSCWTCAYMSMGHFEASPYNVDISCQKRGGRLVYPFEEQGEYFVPDFIVCDSWKANPDYSVNQRRFDVVVKKNNAGDYDDWEKKRA